MRKYLLFSAIALVTVVVCSQTFTAQQTTTPPADQANRRHDPVDSDKAKKMMAFFQNNASKKDHIFTKFSRTDLIAALNAMPELDTVKFVIGAFVDEGQPGRTKGKPVIMLQVRDDGKEQPGGDITNYKYLPGAICPPPNGVCALEQ